MSGFWSRMCDHCGTRVITHAWQTKEVGPLRGLCCECNVLEGHHPQSCCPIPDVPHGFLESPEGKAIIAARPQVSPEDISRIPERISRFAELVYGIYDIDDHGELFLCEFVLG